MSGSDHFDAPDLLGEGVRTELARRLQVGDVEDAQRAVADDVRAVAVHLNEIGGAGNRGDLRKRAALAACDRAGRDDREDQGDHAAMPADARSAR